MNACGLMVGAPTDAALVASVRAGQEAAFEELYRRYRPRINAFVRRYVRDDGRAEDVTQEAFMSALRRMRVTEREIAFKPWIYEIARNAAIDSHRRSRRTEEVSMEAVELMRASDRLRLPGTALPDVGVINAERLQHLRGAFDELSDTHHRVLVMREFEGRSYREIAEQMDLTRPAVESALFRARRRLEHLYAELETGRRCEEVHAAIARLAEGMEGAHDIRRLARHARRCSPCRRRARELGVEPMGRFERVRAKAAAFLPLPALLRSRAASSGAAPHEPLVAVAPAAGSTGQAIAAFAERAAALLAAAALASAGSAVLQERLEAGNGSGAATAQPPPAGGVIVPRLTFPSPPARPGRGSSRQAPRAGTGAKQSSAPRGPDGKPPSPRAQPESPTGASAPSGGPTFALSAAKRAIGGQTTMNGAQGSLTDVVRELPHTLRSSASVVRAGTTGALAQTVETTLLRNGKHRPANGKKDHPRG